MVKSGVTDAFMKYVKTKQTLKHLDGPDSNSITSSLAGTDNSLNFETIRDLEFDKSFLAVFLDEDEEMNCWNDLLRNENYNNDGINMLR